MPKSIPIDFSNIYEETAVAYIQGVAPEDTPTDRDVVNKVHCVRVCPTGLQYTFVSSR